MNMDNERVRTVEASIERLRARINEAVRKGQMSEMTAGVIKGMLDLLGDEL